MAMATVKEGNGPLSGQTFTFERNEFLGRVLVDFDPGPELNLGIYSEAEFENTFDVIEE